MGCKFIAELRKTREKVVLCDNGPMELYLNIMDQFQESDNILRFYIEENNVIIHEKILEPKAKGRSRIR